MVLALTGVQTGKLEEPALSESKGAKLLGNKNSRSHVREVGECGEFEQAQPFRMA